jgi:hypothetical protein
MNSFEKDSWFQWIYRCNSIVRSRFCSRAGTTILLKTFVENRGAISGWLISPQTHGQPTRGFLFALAGNDWRTKPIGIRTLAIVASAAEVLCKT